MLSLRQAPMTVAKITKLKIQSKHDDYWKTCGIHSKNILSDKTQAEDAAHKLTQKTGRANLLFLCDLLDLTYDPNHTVKPLTDSLIAGLKDSFLLLCEFAKKHGESVKEQYSVTFAKDAREGVERLVTSLADGKPEPVKILTMALLMFGKDPDLITLTYCRSAWRKRQTHHEFVSDKKLDDSLVSKLITNKERVESWLTERNNKNPVTFKSHKELNPGLHVFHFKRKYGQSVKEDFVNGFNVHNPFGNLLIGIDVPSKRLIIKNENKSMADEIKQWVEDALEVKLRDLRIEPYSEYSGDEVQHAFLGGYDSKHEIEIVGMKFRRSISPNHTNLMIETPLKSMNIKEDLAWYKEKEVIALTNLSDLTALNMVFRGHECSVDVKSERNGLVRFKFNDIGWDESLQVEFHEVFKKCFGIPLNLPINPSSLSMGNLGIYRYLLSCKYRRDVLKFQEKALEDLIAMGLIEEGKETQIVCPTATCEKHNVKVVDEDEKQCLKCSATLVNLELKTLKLSTQKAITIANKAMAEASGMKVSSKKNSFSTVDFYQVIDNDEKKETIFICHRDKLTKKLHDVISRFSQPVILIHATGQYQHAYTDPAGLTHLELAYVLASSSSKDSKKKFKEYIKDTIDALRRTTEERVVRAAGKSYETIIEVSKAPKKPADYEGNHYEMDMFNIFRSLFPNTSKWGGNDKPDGLCSLIHFLRNKGSAPQKFNFTYDTKLTGHLEKGYDLSIDEKRKIWDYIESIIDVPPFNEEGNELNGHAIVSNSVTEPMRKHTAEYIRKKHGLGKLEGKGIEIIFITQDFVTELYDYAASNWDHLRRKRNYLYERMHHYLTTRNSDHYSLLDSKVAKEIIEYLQQPNTIETPINNKLLRKNLDARNK
jgi:hypothetical protein